METNIGLFGDMSDVDNDPKLIVFIYPIPGYQGQAFDGFFRAEDLAPFQAGCEANPMAYCSNEAEMIHVNSLNAGSDYMVGVMAHEFEHLIHHAYDQNEESWINEGLAELAMSANGYEDAGHLHAYLTNHSEPLVSAEFAHYGAGMLWGTFLYERFGADYVQALVKAPQNGIEGLEAAWNVMGMDDTFASALAEWALWNAIDGYELLDLPAMNPDGAIPTLVDGYAAGEVSVPPTSYLWLAGPVIGAGAHQDLIIRFEAVTEASLRVVGKKSGELVDATAVQAGGWRIAANVDELIVALANPSGNVANVSVGFELAAIETPDDVTPDAALPEVVEDLSGETDTIPNNDTSDDTADTDSQGEGVSDYCKTHCCDYACEEGGDDDASGCTMGSSPTDSAPWLLLAALGLLIARRRSLRA
jgi:MYXO-CTERM domain-containing protein